MENGLIAATESDIQNLVYSIRGKKVMFDSDLGKIYGVTTSRLNEQVKRNQLRFPADFMFQLSKQEWADLMSQNAISNVGEDLMSQNAISNRGGRRKLPFVFTEHGALMLASVLNTAQAISASLQVVRVFVKIREIVSSNHELSQKLSVLETKYDSQFKEVFEALRQLMSVSTPDAEQLILRKGIKE
ncbi:MAG: ORF6N domain-containing protein [Paludibacter sp.]|nr:ORF6N domain-containing protein [Paludibacter sp.]